jgi:hypothetical protein
MLEVADVGLDLLNFFFNKIPRKGIGRNDKWALNKTYKEVRNRVSFGK